MKCISAPRRRHTDNNFWLSYRELADQLVPYAKWMGFTHLELLPVNEHPFDGSWGYQPTGLYAPTRRFGTRDDFRYFINAAHAAGLNVILDWVPGHFPADDFALASFDGTSLYEHSDPREGYHRGLEYPDLQLRTSGSQQLPRWVTRCTGSNASASMRCGSTRWPR